MGYVIILTDSKSGVAEFGFALTFTIHTQTHFVIELFSLRLRSVVKDPINSELEFCGFKVHVHQFWDHPHASVLDDKINF